MIYNLEGDKYTMCTRKYSNDNTSVDFWSNDFPVFLLLKHRYTVDDIYEIVKRHDEGRTE